MLKGTGTLGTSLVLETDGIMTRQRVQNQILTRPYDDRHFAVRLPSLSLWRSTHCSEHMDAHTHLHISSRSLSHTHTATFEEKVSSKILRLYLPKPDRIV